MVEPRCGGCLDVVVISEEVVPMHIVRSYRIAVAAVLAVAVASCVDSDADEGAALGESTAALVEDPPEQAPSEDTPPDQAPAEPSPVPSPDTAGEAPSSDGVGTQACFRPPHVGGLVNFNFNVDGRVWRYKKESSDRNWYGARRGEISVDGIHRNGWGCRVWKIPDNCTATVTAGGDVSCCCVIPFGPRCSFTSPSGIGANNPPGC